MAEARTFSQFGAGLPAMLQRKRRSAAGFLKAHRIALAGVVVVLLIGWLALGVIIQADYDSEVHRGYDSAELSAQRLANHTARVLDQTARIALLVKHLYERDGTVDFAALSKAGLLGDSDATSVALVDSAGNLFASTHTSDKLNFSDRAHFQAARSRTDMVMAPPVFARITRRWVLPTALQLSNADGSFAGVVLVALDAKALTSGYEHDEGPEKVIAILGRDGIFRSRRVGKTHTSGESMDPRRAEAVLKENNPRISERSAIDNIARFPTAVPVAGTDLLAVVAVAESFVMAPHFQLRRGLIAAGLGGSLAFLIIAFVWARQAHRASLSDSQKRRSEATQAAILNAMPAHIALVDAANCILSVNDSWRSHDCVTAMQDPLSGVGRNFSEVRALVYGGSGQTSREIEEGIRFVLNGGTQIFELDYQGHSGEQERWFRLAVVPVVIDVDRHAVIRQIDITDRKIAEEALLQSQRLTRVVGKVARIGGWSVDARTQTLVLSEELRSIYGMEASEPTMLEQTAGRIVPEHHFAAAEAFRLCLSESVPYDIEIEAMTAGGRRFWARVIGQPILDAAGTVIGVQGATQDISERKRDQDQLLSLIETTSTVQRIMNRELEGKVAARTMQLEAANASLAEREQEIHSVLENMADGVITVNKSGIIRAANSMVQTLFGYPPAELVGENLALLIPGVQIGQSAGDLDMEALAERSLAIARRELLGLNRNGERIALDVAFSKFQIKGERWYTAIVRDIRERQRILADLRQARIDAEEGSRAKSAFVATMSHEIRTPMNGVIGMIDVLQQTRLDADQAEMVELARDSAHSLMGIVDSVLDFSKIEAGKVELESQPMSIAQIVEKVNALSQTLASKSGVRLSLFVDSRIPKHVLGDAAKLRQVLVNLMSNAIKFSSGSAAGGQVAMRATLVEQLGATACVKFVIVDNGVGVDEPTLARLFTPFTQADASTTARFGGTGLGLAIVRALVHMMGGDVSVDSVVGKGSAFTVQLTVAVVSAQQQQEARTPIRTPAPAQTSSLPDSRFVARPILVAEDNKVNQRVIAHQLKLLGYSSHIADDGMAALEAWKNGDFSLLLTDLRMPLMDGYLLAASVRSSEPEGQRIPIVALTANALREESALCAAAGMDDYATKPIGIDDLQRLLQKWIPSARAVP
ncbi:MAG: PAS domain S-box protein [Burkholderiaceae bacterium]|nr:PAS domain S-box protein [Burkholderiaceae bacterium]